MVEYKKVETWDDFVEKYKLWFVWIVSVGTIGGMWRDLQSGEYFVGFNRVFGEMVLTHFLCSIMTFWILVLMWSIIEKQIEKKKERLGEG